MSESHVLETSKGKLNLDSPRVMGILNITPDSFSDGGKYHGEKKAIDRAWEIAKEGADILDVGAESTRPGAKAVSLEEEGERVFPVLEALAKDSYPLPISFDTTKAELLEEAIEKNWIHMINDVEGLRNPAMQRVARESKLPTIIMHMFGDPRTMQDDYHYEDVVKDLKKFFVKRLEEIQLSQMVILDPGIGFGKSVEHNLQILNRIPEFLELGHPLLIGASRKSFIGKILDQEVQDRLEGSLASAIVAASKGAQIFRVHDVKETARALKLTSAILSA